MKFRFSLFIKSALFVILLSLILVSVQFVTYEEAVEVYRNRTVEAQKNTTINALNDYLEYFFIENTESDYINGTIQINKLSLFENLSNRLNVFIIKYAELYVSKINVVIIDESKNLTVFVSTDNQTTNNAPEDYNLSEFSILKNLTFFNLVGKNDYLLITPINVNINNTLWRVGAYEIFLNTEVYSIIYENTIKVLSLMFLALIITYIIAMLLYINKFIIKPLKFLFDNTKKIGKGKFDEQVDIKSRDEIGDLGAAFNQMARDLKESRDKIEDYNRILENLLKQKDEFIGQLGHDLKNPLQPLVGLLPMLIENEKNPKTKEILEVMNQNVIYMTDLIFDTLELAKLRHSNIQFNFENLNLLGTLEIVLKSEKLMLEENKIKIDNTISNNIFVWADKLRLIEIFKNLITNSIKYKKGDEGNITISANIERDLVKISIKDDGIGMSEDQLKKVFDEFYKADKTSSDKKSTGLGLYICKKIVEKHNGKTWVESAGIGKGSTFYFTLKVSKGKGDEKQS